RGAAGLTALRGGTTLSELLFLYDCATESPTRLEPIAERLGVSVQAVSHAYRRLSRQGFAEVLDGRYRPTVRGVEWLHQVLGALAEDLFLRQNRLRIIRSCRAVALADIRAGAPVALELVEGLLSARPGRGSGSRGRAVRDARRGELLEVGDLEGILSLRPAPIRLIVVPLGRLPEADAVRRLADVLDRAPEGLLGAHGVGGVHLLRRATPRPFVRFAAGASALEASRLGVPGTIVVAEEDLGAFLAPFAGSDPPLWEIETLGGGRLGPTRRRGESRERAKRGH
ncbi:MAG TPA: hypothetical protein VLY85_00265, partial [Thermoplasmata archaeon]|nr:hypothetical protein [Thermoplasmata archaeon]